MTIYMVQHSFARPDWEDEWNAWYAGNLKVLMGVPGFITGQRFKSPDGVPPRYMAVYTVESPAVFESKPYIQAGGGGISSQRFRPAYQVWIRNLFEGIDAAPEVREGQYLLLVDAAQTTWSLPGVPVTWLTTTGFHRTTPYRGIAIVGPEHAEALRHSSDVIVYRPITALQGPLY